MKGGRVRRGSIPQLSITMPTRNRPELFERALGSVLRACGPVSDRVEVTVSDGSDDHKTREVVERLLADWPGRYQYVWNNPALALVDNLNRAMALASGEWIHQLHDDDLLLANAGQIMCDAIGRAGHDQAVLLFGVEIVDQIGKCKRRQTFRRERHLNPAMALERALRNSSFVRHPGIVVHRRALQETGMFDTAMGNPADVDLWVRLFSRYGVRCIPQANAAYTIHEASLTTGMWNADTIRTFEEIFDRAVASGVVPERKIRRWQADFSHQFILAGAYRRLRLGRHAEAREILRLFNLPSVRELGPSPKWAPVRAVFTAATFKAPRTIEHRQ